MRRVELCVFRAGSYGARLQDVDTDGTVAFTTRGHETWAKAASAALKKADRSAWEITNRTLVTRKIAAEGT